MKRPKTPRWSVAEVATVSRMRKAGAKWDVVAAALPGRTVGACQLAHYGAKGRQLRDQQRAKPAQLAKQPTTAAPVQFLPARSSAAVSTDRLRVDAELRARIEILGITGGLLGDPIPGRSALDRLHAGGTDEAARVDRRVVQLGPKITLAGKS